MIFDRFINMIGEERFSDLKRKKVMVFGLGGVGSFAAEALVRSGIGEIGVCDFDKVEETNLNRQLIALSSTIDKYKVEVFNDRALDINPDLNIKIFNEKVSAENISQILSDGYDFVIDCIDDVDAKVEIAKYCLEKDIKFIASMGFANKFHPEMIKIKKMNQTSVCPLAKTLRRKLKIAGYSLDFPVCYSEEKPAKLLDNSYLGSTSYTPSAAGLHLAAYVVNHFIGENI